MKPTPARALIRFAVVDEHGEIKTGLHRSREPMDRLVREQGEPGERVAEFECKEKKQ